MTRSHAKNNTTQSTLTYYERSLLRADSAAKRIGHDSFKPLDSCNLCLSRITAPVACAQGHIYCKECLLANLISQKAGIEGQRREMERWEANDRRERDDARSKARERVVKDFERGMGLGERAKAVGAKGETGDKTFDLSMGNVDAIAAEAEEKAMRTIEAEQVEARKAKLAAFWLPSLAPEAPLGPLKEVKLQTLCHVGGQGHPIARKALLPVIFTYPPTTALTPSPKPICPSCSKELSNSVACVLLTSTSPVSSSNEPAKKKSKKEKGKEDRCCGHVVCLTCADKVVKPSKRCCVCEAGVEDKEIIPLGKEGTGFAAAGGAEVKKETLAFRV
ncbi:nitric oxide synthase-interacting protein, partial [Tremellales sp. Uapishka_1]